MPGSVSSCAQSTRSFGGATRPLGQTDQSPLGAAATTADNISMRRNPQRKTVNVNQLNAIATQFETFYGELEPEVTAEHEKEEDRLVAVERWVQRIERSLVTEQERRVEMYGLVVSNLQQQFDALNHRTTTQLETLRPEIPNRIAMGHERLGTDEQALDEEKIRTRKLIEREKARNLKTLADFEAALEIEKVERLEREAQTLKKIIDENFGLGQMIDEERARREATLGHVRDENDDIDRVRDLPDKIFKDDMMTRMVRATKDIRLETARRVSAERQFVESLEAYTKSLQSGLRLVNSKAKPEW
eukprot:CAMPEP_0119325008 /NCGR_PEP_ID=MMETSP1333-20130426/64744_1 /TAXON_ID=418940 /ORGANISM="Scyphosphaera apsteinii, Strain RCC1455" /LENGTH=302 /DNA_ID=CAMNT_0007332865 /DNA_START=46 /DNA_END=951 /DNA_ORIENTATION=+